MPQPYDVAAYYWPAYHDEPRWRRFMPAGEGEWEIIRRARPRFPGHYQPRVPQWGYGNEADPQVMAQKIAAAVDHGVNVMIFDWYWYDNQPFLEDCLNRGFLQAPNHDRMRFYLMWANHNATSCWLYDEPDKNRLIWPGAVDAATFDRLSRHVVERYLTHPAYYRIGGQPVLAIYELGTFIKGLGSLDAAAAALERWRELARRAGLPGIHFQGILWGELPASLSGVPGDRTPTQAATVQRLGLDSLTNYQWVHYVTPQGPYRAWADSAMRRWDEWAGAFPVPFLPHVSIGWDNNPRHPEFCPGMVTDTSPALFGECLAKAKDFLDRHPACPRLLTVNAWNEWSEGSYLEPDARFGGQYLEAVRQVFGPATAR